MVTKSDLALLGILKEEKNITNLLDTFFGFLYRCTDFFVEYNPELKLGFPPGVAEELILHHFRRWKEIYETKKLGKTHEKRSDHIKPKPLYPMPHNLPGGNVALTVDVHSEDADMGEPPKKRKPPIIDTSDWYNGADRGNYCWSQTIEDLDVNIKIPSTINSVKDVDVKITTKNIYVRVKINEAKDGSYRMNWSCVFDGKLRHNIKKDDSIWSLSKEKGILIHLEKASHQWWKALIEGEPDINLVTIDSTRNMDDLGSEETMKIEEIIYNHEQRTQERPTTSRNRPEDVLRRAWNVAGSPFAGLEFDPSVIENSDENS